MSSPSFYNSLFPWPQLEKGQGFFIPCLDLEKVRLFGLNQALNHRVFDAQAYPGVRGGLIGVWFFRKPPAHG